MTSNRSRQASFFDQPLKFDRVHALNPPRALKPLCIPPPTSMEELEARLDAAAMDLTFSSSSSSTCSTPFALSEDDSSLADDDDDNDEEEYDEDSSEWLAVPTTPLYSSSHSEGKPLKPALKSAYSCSSGVSVQFCDNEPETWATWSADSYSRAGPPPLTRLSMKEVLEMRELNLGMWFASAPSSAPKPPPPSLEQDATAVEADDAILSIPDYSPTLSSYSDRGRRKDVAGDGFPFDLAGNQGH